MLPLRNRGEPASPLSITPRWLGLSLLLIALAFWLDNRVDAALDVRALPAWSRFATGCSKVGEWWIIGVVGILVATILIRRRHLEMGRGILLAVITAGLTGLTATILRTLIGRTRPSNTDTPQGFYGIWHNGHWILGRPEFSSFPSGHSATVAGLAMAAWMLDRRAGAVAWAFALLVMWSRIATAWHHLSDVVAATVLGIAGAKLIFGWLPPLLRVWTERFRL